MEYGLEFVSVHLPLLVGEDRTGSFISLSLWSLFLVFLPPKHCEHSIIPGSTMLSEFRPLGPSWLSSMRSSRWFIIVVVATSYMTVCRETFLLIHQVEELTQEGQTPLDLVSIWDGMLHLLTTSRASFS
ncbi:uncharacterized protein BDW47DRAFT_113275 [Aspergillus candidus]|uniref:Uncharacterized protein n=1 Tax=Aspergillus candidus TaxID=41067 RepID=A0A2I2EZK8_ASPCN|nr:hypothetical protein BDW47DRAFT_113275 [Aspergillus candidus]PLB33823.1 hypothetical protein BDW47DRAFT_113275 [Aspergillus candidus]